MNYILGIDPGYANVGWAVISQRHEHVELVASGVIKTDAGMEEMHRYRVIDRNVWGIVSHYEPNIAVLEGLPPNKHQNKQTEIAGARGVILNIIAVGDEHCDNGIALVEISPTEVKKLITGKGQASKEKIGEYVKLLLGLDEPLKPDHASDAAACALAYLIKEGVLE
ncbi:MAG: crossover junction endodeoxyribonuclease RuvC [Methanosarcinales archaeon]